MKISILTLFPEFFDGFLTNSIIKRALAKEKVQIEIINIRDFTLGKYGRVDSAPVGGGAGLIMKCQPVLDCLKSVKTKDSHVILLSPRGKTYNQARAPSVIRSLPLRVWSLPPSGAHRQWGKIRQTRLDTGCRGQGGLGRKRVPFSWSHPGRLPRGGGISADRI